MEHSAWKKPSTLPWLFICQGCRVNNGLDQLKYFSLLLGPWFVLVGTLIIQILPDNTVQLLLWIVLEFRYEKYNIFLSREKSNRTSTSNFFPTSLNLEEKKRTQSPLTVPLWTIHVEVWYNIDGLRYLLATSVWSLSCFIKYVWSTSSFPQPPPWDPIMHV